MCLLAAEQTLKYISLKENILTFQESIKGRDVKGEIWWWERIQEAN